MAKILRNIDQIIDTQGNDLTAPVLSFRNKIINGDMRIAQRGNLPYAGTAAGFTFDRWYLRKSNSNNNPISKLDEQEVLDLGKVSVLKVENFADSAWIGQKIESFSVLPLANKTVTVSFYAKADTNTSGFRVFLHESNFNSTHGSPYFSYDVPITTSWQKFSYSMTIGDLVAVDDNAYLNLGFGQSSTNTTVYLTGIQLEEGSVATPFEHRPIGVELSLCQRYYQIVSYYHATGSNSVNTMYYVSEQLRTSMRSSPALVADYDYGLLTGRASTKVSATNYDGLIFVDATKENVTVRGATTGIFNSIIGDAHWSAELL